MLQVISPNRTVSVCSVYYDQAACVEIIGVLCCLFMASENRFVTGVACSVV